MRRSKNQARRRDPLPENFHSVEEFCRFWNTHSTADYEELMEDVDVHVDIRSSKIYCPVMRLS
jgi:hypothetical protein